MNAVIKILWAIATVTILVFGHVRDGSAASTPDGTADLLNAVSSDANKVRELLDAGAQVNAIGLHVTLTIKPAQRASPIRVIINGRGRWSQNVAIAV